jgi:hypothetical protein
MAKSDRIVAIELSLSQSVKDYFAFIIETEESIGILDMKLLKEFVEYTPPPDPPYNTDAYWDWRCDQAKRTLHINIDSAFQRDRFWQIYRECGVLLNASFTDHQTLHRK